MGGRGQWGKGMLAVLLGLLLSLTGWGAGGAGIGQADSASSSYKVVGYFTNWGIYDPGFQVENVDASKLTHLNYSFADLCWNGKHGNPSNDPGNPNKATWNCKDAGVPTQTGNVPNGAIVLGDPWADVNNDEGVPLDWEDCEKGKCGNFYKLKMLKQSNPNLKTLLSVGGWTWSNHFSDVAADPTARTNFANSAVNVIRTYGFDGIDIDWEYPVSDGLPDNSQRPEDKHNFTLLLQETRDKLTAAGAQDGRSYLLTIAGRANSSYASTTELSTIAGILDWINIMTYDFHGDWDQITNHNASLYSDPSDPDTINKFSADSAINAYIQAGVPASKIVMGIPFYGRGWKNCAPGPNGDGLYQTCTPDFNGSYVPNGTWDNYESGPTGMFDYGDLAAGYVNKNGFTRSWSQISQVPYLYNPSSKTFISYEDPQSLTAKTTYIKNRSLGGAMIWDLSEDCRTSPKFTCTGTKLLSQLASELQGNTTPPDTTAPTTPTHLNSPSQTATTITLNWDASQDNVGVTGYDVYQGQTLLTRVTGTTYTVTGLAPQTSYTFTVRAADAAGNISDPSAPLTVSTLAEGTDTQAPTVPTNLTVTTHTDTTVSLQWGPSTDNVAVTGYDIYQGNTLVGTVSASSTSFTVSGLTPQTRYTFSVKAKDAVGNISPASNIVQVTTDASGPVTVPAWAPNTAYVVGTEVSYGGVIYTCQQPHTSLPGWEPPNVPALWSKK
ncbi:glycosyl hydrolase family 18 protein [Paenibacillus sp.]|uniref:glycosyl hydrolase family 18 protein n=1 Tax=Paenibacillus sp. TaxID=58172 RepID=UPI00281DD8FE|nr:glycosyl hydrolase family 18 protein [Paenibacillus sp.]MDR0269542.1 fibronectin type III domain-containing protein [Paenibacillus sp.]